MKWNPPQEHIKIPRPKPSHAKATTYTLLFSIWVGPPPTHSTGLRYFCGSLLHTHLHVSSSTFSLPLPLPIIFYFFSFFSLLPFSSLLLQTNKQTNLRAVSTSNPSQLFFFNNIFPHFVKGSQMFQI